MTKSVDRRKSRNYVEKAESLLEVARYALNNKKHDAAVINAVHSAINALDSFTVLEKGLRASGEHEDVLVLIKGLLSSDEYAIYQKTVFITAQSKKRSRISARFYEPEGSRRCCKVGRENTCQGQVKIIGCTSDAA